MADFDFDTMKQAIERRDADLLTNLYADGAVIRVVDKVTTPSAPNELVGREAIDGFLRDICGREMTHEVTNDVVADHRVSFTEACRYPDGTRVLSANIIDLDGDRIVNHLMVQAWDE